MDRSFAFISGYIWLMLLRPCCLWEDHATSMVVLGSGRKEEPPDDPREKCHGVWHRKRFPNSGRDQAKKKGVPSEVIPSAVGNGKTTERSGGDHVGTVHTIHRRIAMQNPRIDQLEATPRLLSKPILKMQSLSVATDAGASPATQDVIGSHQRGKEATMSPLVIERMQIARRAKRPSPPEQGVRRKSTKRVDDVAGSLKLGDLITADHNIWNVRNVSRCGHRSAPVVQDAYTSWMHGYPMKTKKT